MIIYDHMIMVCVYACVCLHKKFSLGIGLLLICKPGNPTSKGNLLSVPSWDRMLYHYAYKLPHKNVEYEFFLYLKQNISRARLTINKA